MFPPSMRSRVTHDPFSAISREFDRAMSRYFGESEVPASLAPYPVDVREDADHFYVEAELPGFMKEDVDLTLENGILTIRASRKEVAKVGELIHTERHWTNFQRSFTMPVAVNEASVKAELADGVLKVTLDKREEVKPRKIQVQGGCGRRWRCRGRGRGRRGRRESTARGTC